MYHADDLQNIADILESVNDEQNDDDIDLLSSINNKCNLLIEESKKLYQEKKVLKIMRAEIEKELKV